MSRRPLITVSALLFFLVGGIEEQRDRLPPVETQCSDAVTGEWVSHVYFPHVRQWYRMKLRIERGDGDGALKGNIHSEYWLGGETEVNPGACEDPHYRRAVLQPAQGHLVGNTLHFAGTSYEPDATHPCGTGGISYGLDVFEGTIDTEALEYQAVLNSDGPQWVNVPILFRRVTCIDGGTASSPEARQARDPNPPPVRRRSRGWGCW